jgi:hypothetical protein
MKLRNLYYGFIIACCFGIIRAQAQTNNYFIPTVFSKSPASAEFAKYGDYPVNLYSGLPEISIPLYTIEAGSLQVPITLSYHASGIKVNEQATWAGLGWSVSAGGGINREVRGRDDETGYFTGPSNSGMRDASTLHPMTSDADIDWLYQDVTQFGKDTRPDIYSYDLPGHSGKFFFNGKNNYKPVFIPFAPMLLKRNATSALSFTMTDEHGNDYIIGKTYTETTSTTTTSGQHSQPVTAWKLESIIGQNKRDTINFTYQSQPIFINEVGQVVTVEDQQNNIVPGNGCPIQYISNLNSVGIPSDNDSQVGEQDPSEITFRNGKVVFKTGTFYREPGGASKGYALDTIKVFTYNFGLKTYELQKSIVFYKSYFNVLSGQAARLKLDSIQVRDKAGSIIQHYRFDYNNQALPGNVSFSRDYWGYYNGKMDGVSNPTLIPKTQIDYQPSVLSPGTNIYIGGSDPNSRMPDSVKMQAGVLKTIWYPTGGHTTFAYQTNRYLDSFGAVQLTGGLRVNTISSYDGISATPIVKTYQYNTATPNFLTIGSSGLINYGFFLHTMLSRYFNNFPAQVYSCVSKRVRSYNSEPSNNLTPTEGNPVAYTNVTEYTGTPTANIGKSVYTFRYTSDALQTASLSGVPVIYDYFFARGQLTEKDDYMLTAGGSYQIVKKQVNNYTAFLLTNYTDVGLVAGQAKYTEGIVSIAYPDMVVTGSDNDGAAFPFSNYNIVSDDNYLTGTTTTTYDMADITKFVSSSVAYNYDDTLHQQVASIVHVDSRGNTQTTANKFAYNFPLTSGSTGNAVLDTMISRHIYAEGIEKTQSITYASPATTKTIGSQLNIFQFGSFTGSIVPSKISILSISSPVTDFTPSSVASGNVTGDIRYKQMISFDTYDAKNNITQYTPRNSPPVSILWDYLYELPVAQVKNMAMSNNNIAYTGFEADSKGGWIFSGVPVNDATAPTGSYVYPLSAGNITTIVLDVSKSFVVSYWSNNGAAALLYGSTYITGVPLRIAKGWTYYEHPLPASGSGASITISGTTSIDELRLYPVGAQMTTYAYDPSGIRSITDTKGQVSYFEYDPFQRLKNIKDWNGYIVKNFGYHTYDQTVGNDAMGPATFTRNNCPIGTTPGTVSYSVPANRYYSSTKASANAQATYDLNSTGQLNANTTAGCPITMVTYTLTNTSGTSGYQAGFSGPNTYLVNFPGTPSIAYGTYSITVNAVGTATHTFTLGTRTPITGHSATFTGVNVTPGSSDLTLSITP